jgi:hypothetical protein
MKKKRGCAGSCGCGCLALPAMICLVPVLLVSMVSGIDFSKMIDRFPHLCRLCLSSDIHPVSQDARGLAIAQAAIDLAGHLYGIPDKWFDALVPQETLHYWQTACPSGSNCFENWQSGNLQCVLFVMGAFALAHARGESDMMPVSGNAVEYASLYAHQPGWQEILPGQGFPRVGDAVVWSGNLYGHIAIVVQVDLPRNDLDGSVIIAQANGPVPLEQMPLRPDGIIDTSQWKNGYQLLAYIRDNPNVS